MIRNILSIVPVFFIGSTLHAQVEIHFDNDLQTVYNGQTIDYLIDHDFGFHKVYMHCQNTSGSDAKYKFAREILSQDAPFTDQLCDNNLCYPLNGNIDTTGAPTLTVADGDSSTMQPIFTYNNSGNALIRYYVLDANNNNTLIDSFDLNITSVLSISKEDISFSAYPNPANEIFNIKFQGKEGLVFSLQIYNLVGAEVMRSTLNNGNNIINVEGMTDGIYFFSIVGNKEIIETKKLLIRH